MSGFGDCTAMISSPQEGTVAFQNNYSHDISSQQQHTTPALDPNAVSGPASSEDESENHYPVKTFVFRRKALRSNMQIFDVGSQVETPSYFAAVREWKLNTPDVTLHAGTDATADILGVAHFRFSRHIMLGLGNPSRDASSVVWEKMQRQTFFKNKWTFEFTDPNACDMPIPSINAPARRHFIWQRTNNSTLGVKGVGKLSIRNVRLVDQDSGDVVAVFLADNLTSLKRKGELRIFQKLSTELERIIILGCASIAEKMHRD
ncbi:uncharacterized protein A1O9_09017 [Exophiala aquamarina CBS 119918]|uniref:Uncharacterized protein n=1 Tax=Exophiala aquamarina CBS 119918 TaxID=1182545 RepID=A0A072PG82_9EURO|nr:uncharacterized protein A1O9_09017 [Exophiala aquamarina CBS 119918]KEF54575.1 hypothetical protein A1O9_09017 [Exophiala aquamarina CBS 119918]